MKLNRIWRRATALSAACAFTAGIALASTVLPDTAALNDGPILMSKPPFESGNPVTCTTDQGGAEGLGYPFGITTTSTPADGATYNLVANGVTLGTVTVDVIDSETINWTSTYPLQAVIMKGGDDANVYPYDAVPNEAELAGSYPYLVNYFTGRTYPDPNPKADNGLVTPGQGTSHVEFCFRNDEPLVRPPDISKTAVPSWTRYHDWTLEKSVDPDSVDMFDGDTHDVNYTITTTKDPWGNFTVSGVIELSDPLAQGLTVNSVADTMIFSADPDNTEFHPVLDCGYVADGDVFYRCTYSHTLSSKVHGFLAAGGTGVNTAVASVSFNGQTVLTDPAEATAEFTFPADPAASFGDSLDVDDSMVDGTGTTDHTFTDAGSWVYPHTFSCPDDEGDKPNTAIGTFTGVGGQSGSVQDSANVDVGCHEVTVQKTAYTRFHRDYDWAPDKKIVVRPEDLTVEEKTTHCSLIDSGAYANNYLCDDITIKLPTGGVYDTVYALKATKDSGTDSDREVYGTIKVSWGAGLPVPVFSGDPTDELSFAAGLPATIAGTVSGCTAGVNQINCDYVASVPDLRSGTNTASIDRPHVCYNADGTTKACAVPGTSTYSGQAPFSFDEPTSVADECVSLSDLFNGTAGLNLGPTFGWNLPGEICVTNTVYVTGEVVPGKFLDIYADWAPDGFEAYTPACTFYVPNVLTLHTDDGADESDEAVIGVNVPDACNQGCTLTQGYWKTHAIYAAKPQFAKKRDANWDSVGGENAIFFLSGKTWINVFWTAPKGDAYYNLAHQYMAAVLNKNNGASVPTNVATAIASATTFFETHTPGTLSKADKTTATSLAATLAAYNEGKLGPVHCSEAPPRTGLIAQ